MAAGLHGLANVLHAMTLRLLVLRGDLQCVARQATTIDALGAALAEATETVERLHAAVAKRARRSKVRRSRDPR